MNGNNRRAAAVLAGIAFVGAAEAALVAEWNFDDQSLTNVMSAAGLHQGAVVSGGVTNPVVGTAVFSTNTPSGSGYALDLSSAADYMMIANSSTNYDEYADTFETATNFSYSMWVMNTSGSWNAYGSIASKGNEAWKQDDALKVGFELRAQNFTTAANGVRVEFWGEASVQDPAPYTDLTDGAWHLLTYTFDGTSSNLSLYVDGALTAAGTGTAFRPAPGKLLLFGAVEGEEDAKQSDCICDTIQFYDHALSAAEVDALYIPQNWFTVDADEIELTLTAPDTLVTGVVNAAYMSTSHVEVNVSFSNETHAGAFSLLETMPLVLTNTAPDSTPIQMVFDADQTGGMTNGEIASCTAVIAWNEQGSDEVTEVEVPVSVTYQVLLTDVVVSILELGASTDAVNPINLSSNGPADWVMLGMNGSTSSRNEMDGADYIGEVTVIGTHGAYAGNAYQSSWTNGSPIVRTNNVQGSWEGQGETGAFSFSLVGLEQGEYSMNIYCSKYRATAQLTAAKGGASITEAFTYGGTTVTRYGVFTVDFTIGYGETLDFLYEQVTRTSIGNVGITAITLERVSAPLDPTPGDVAALAVVGGTNLILSFETTAGYQYGVEATDNLAVGIWSDMAIAVEGTGGAVLITNALSADDPQMFYRAYLQE